ncbi:MAG: FadR family transcriptional regulator [Alicyclobacillus sp.]|nr:FadR family transcriptional regulator [Alicyclobacillus sp.]
MFRKITQTSAADDIIEQIIGAIRSGSLPEGSRMPSERELAEQFQVSRATIREAIRHLSALGFVETRRGLGTFVHTVREAMSDSDMSPEMVMEARFAIEPCLVQLCAIRATPAEVEHMGHILDALDADTAHFELHDNEFHFAIALAARNGILIKTAEAIYRGRSGNLWGTLKARSLTPERIAVYQSQHRAIWSAIAERNGPLAEARLREHLLTTSRSLFGTFPLLAQAQSDRPSDPT